MRNLKQSILTVVIILSKDNFNKRSQLMLRQSVGVNCSCDVKNVSHLWEQLFNYLLQGCMAAQECPAQHNLSQLWTGVCCRLRMERWLQASREAQQFDPTQAWQLCLRMHHVCLCFCVGLPSHKIWHEADHIELCKQRSVVAASMPKLQKKELSCMQTLKACSSRHHDEYICTSKQPSSTQSCHKRTASRAKQLTTPCKIFNNFWWEVFQQVVGDSTWKGLPCQGDCAVAMWFWPANWKCRLTRCHPHRYVCML